MLIYVIKLGGFRICSWILRVFCAKKYTTNLGQRYFLHNSLNIICNDRYIIKVMFVMNSSKSKGTQSILNCYSFRPKVTIFKAFQIYIN